jgi:hypothetical protein
MLGRDWKEGGSPLGMVGRGWNEECSPLGMLGRGWNEECSPLGTPGRDWKEGCCCPVGAPAGRGWKVTPPAGVPGCGPKPCWPGVGCPGIGGCVIGRFAPVLRSWPGSGRGCFGAGRRPPFVSATLNSSVRGPGPGWRRLRCALRVGAGRGFVAEPVRRALRPHRCPG